MISDKDFEKLVEYISFKSPFIEINNNYKDINLYTSILTGETEYQYYTLKKNFENFKKLTENFIISLENIKNFSEKEFKLENIFELKKYIDDFNYNKNKFSPYLKLIDSSVLEKEKITEKIEILYNISKDKSLKNEIENILLLYKTINENFSKENHDLTINDLSNFITKVNTLDFDVVGIIFLLKQNEERSNLKISLIESLLKDIKTMFSDKNNFINEFIEEEFKEGKKFIKFIELKEKLDESYKIFNNNFTNGMNFSKCSEMVLKNSSDIKDFIKIQSFEKTKIELTGVKYSSIEIFEDNSIILNQRNGLQYSASDTKSYYNAIMDVIKNEFNEELKKFPMIAKKFVDEVNSNFNSITNAKIAIKTFLTSKGTLKANGFDILSYFDNYNTIEDPLKRKLFENLDDKMNAIVKEHKVKKFAESIISNKYIHLYDENSYKIFAEILDSNVNATQLQNLIGKKIALYNNAEEFNEGLKKVLDRINGFYLDTYLEKVKEQNAKIISNEDNVLIIQVENFEQSKNLGSTSWCISRDKQYFDSYTSDNKTQFFIYNFKLESTDENSMIGMTFNKDNYIYVCYSKFDEQVTMQTEEIMKYERIIEDKLDSSKLQEEMLKKINEKNLSSMRDFINNQGY